MDQMTITILPDGTIKTETDPISPQNHSSAEAFMKDVQTLTGGAASRQRRGHKHSHGHHHQQQGQK